MKAVSCMKGELSVVDLPELTPENGHVVLDVLRCGICGSDLHARRQCDHLSHLAEKVGMTGFMKSDESVVMGHEFVGEILDYGPNCQKKMKPGTRICAMPILKRSDSNDSIGFSQRSSGGYAERMLVQESMMVAVPNGLSNDIAALTEPMAIGFHAVNRAEMKKNDVAIVVGCGPVGISIICSLKAKGIKHIIACDFSEQRRNLALTCGADEVIDPAKNSPYDSWEAHGHFNSFDKVLSATFSAVEDMDRLPISWWHTWRLLEKLGATAPKRPVIFECVGVPGIINNIIESAPLYSRVVVAGVCMAQDYIEPALAIQKEVELRFSMGYTPLEFRDTLHMLADGKLNGAPLITGTVGLQGVKNAFEVLGSPEEHVKILVNPRSNITTLS